MRPSFIYQASGETSWEEMKFQLVLKNEQKLKEGIGNGRGQVPGSRNSLVKGPGFQRVCEMFAEDAQVVPCG